MLCRYGYRGIQAVCFSSSGGKLATIATDNSHSLFIWDWIKARKLMERKSQPGAPPTVYGVVWSHFEQDRCAKQHCMLRLGIPCLS